ncbi:MAG: response regulator [Phenylobacterium sp.]
MAATSTQTDPVRRVLVVEDDQSICELIDELLTSLDLKSICVGSDREAYDILPTLPQFEALLVDVNLGAGTTGFDVARFARQLIPDLPVIYVSGQASTQSFKSFGVPDSAFVAKPFTADELIEAVRSRIPAND